MGFVFVKNGSAAMFYNIICRSLVSGTVTTSSAANTFGMSDPTEARDPLNDEGEQLVDVFEVDYPLDSRALWRVSALSNLPVLLEEKGVSPTGKAVLVTTVRVDDKAVKYSQLSGKKCLVTSHI